MNDSAKKSILWFTISAILVVIVMVQRTDKSIDVVVDDGNPINKSTCVNAFNSLKVAKFQKKMLDQQVLLSAAAGRGEEAAAVGVQVNELKAMAKVFEKIINNPKLDCNQYLKDEPKVTHKVI